MHDHHLGWFSVTGRCVTVLRGSKLPTHAYDPRTFRLPRLVRAAATLTIFVLGFDYEAAAVRPRNATDPIRTARAWSVRSNTRLGADRAAPSVH